MSTNQEVLGICEMPKEKIMDSLIRLADKYYDERIDECEESFGDFRSAYRSGVLMGYVIAQGELATGCLIDPEED